MVSAAGCSPSGEDAGSLILINKPDQVTPMQQKLTSHVCKTAVRVTTSLSIDSCSNMRTLFQAGNPQVLVPLRLSNGPPVWRLPEGRLDVIGEAALTELSVRPGE